MVHLFRRMPIIAANLLPFLVVIITLRNTPSTSAAVTPVVVTKSNYATVNGILYVEGGAQFTTQYSAFYSLSLTTAWNDASPPWKTLPSNSSGAVAPMISLQSMAVTADNNRLVIWDLSHPTTLAMFNLVSNTWTNSPLPTMSISNAYGQQALVDPTSAGAGVLYMPNGCLNPTPSMCRLDLSVNTITTVAMPTQISSALRYYSFVYCKSRNSMLLYGGIDATSLAASPNLFEYVVATNTWTLLKPQGTSPGDINSHCMVQTSDNTKMILFGGMSATYQFSSSIFILHLSNFTWTQGADAGVANAIAGHTCATNGDSFIVWGGQLNPQNTVAAGSTPLIYNIPTNQWVHDFAVSAPPPTSVTATTTSTMKGTQTSTPGPSNSIDSPPSTGKSSNIGGAIGGAVGGVVVIAAIGFFFYRRRKKASHNVPPPSLKKSGNNDHGLFRRKEGLFGRSNRNQDDDHGHPNGDTVQLQETVTKRGSGEILHLSTSSPLDSTSSAPFMNKPSLPSPPRAVSTPPPPSMLHHSAMSATPLSPTTTLQRGGGGSTGFPPSEQPHYSSYYSGGEEDFSIPRTNPQSHSAAVAYGRSPQHLPINSDGNGVWGEVGRAEPRGPHQFVSENQTSLAASLPFSQVSSGAPHASPSPVLTGISSWDSSNRAWYHPPPPPGPQPVQPENPDLTQKKLMLMKVQRELDMEMARLEQESQVQQVMEGQHKYGL